jgi:hypothetical protein
MRIRRFLWILSMISGLPLILVVGPVLGVWVIGRSWIQHWRENWNRKIPIGAWVVPNKALRSLD